MGRDLAPEARRRLYVGLLATACCWPPGSASGQAAAPAAPPQLTGSFRYHFHWEGATADPSGTNQWVEDLDVQLQNIQMRLDHVSGQQALYVVRSAQPTVTGSYMSTQTFPRPGCRIQTQTDFAADPVAASARVGTLQIDVPASGGALCGANALLGWNEPFTEEESVASTCPGSAPTPSPGSGEASVVVPFGAVKGTETAVVGLVRVEFSYTSTTPAVPQSTAGATGTLTQTLQGSFFSAGAADLAAVDLEIDGVPSSEKQTVGFLVIKHFTGEDGDNMPPRQKITLSGCNSGGKVVLEDPGDKVKIYAEPSGGEALKFDGADNVFDSAKLPKDFYVEGVEASDEMRDIHIAADVEEAGVAQAGTPSTGRRDSVSGTSLAVDRPTVRRLMHIERVKLE